MRLMFTRLITIMALLAGSTGAMAGHEPDRRTVEQATWLIKKATLVHRSGQHRVLLRALRQLRDPELTPLFAELEQRRHPDLKIHGILGLGELSTEGRINLAFVAALEDRGVQARLVDEAIEQSLLSNEDARQLVSWPGFDAVSKLIAGAKLIAEDDLGDAKVLDGALRAAGESDNLFQRGIAALLRVQMGHDGAMQELINIDMADQTDRQRDAVRQMLVQTVLRYRFDKAGPWAMRVATEPRTDPKLALMALRAAIEFEAPNAAVTWKQQFESTEDPADRIRLTLLGLDGAAKMDPKLFESLIADSEPLMHHTGLVGQAIAAGRPVDELIGPLIDLNRKEVSRWAYQYALDLPVPQGRNIYLKLIDASETASADRTFAVLSTQKLYEDDAPTLPMLQKRFRDVSDLTQEVMLMGLIRSRGSPQEVIEGVDEFKSRLAGSMAVLLRGKHGESLSDADMAQLARALGGGGQFMPPLRIQAAWTYLKITEQHKTALANILGRESSGRSDASTHGR